MPWFIFEANIAHFMERLEKETDPQTIASCESFWPEKRQGWRNIANCTRHRKQLVKQAAIQWPHPIDPPANSDPSRP